MEGQGDLQSQAGFLQATLRPLSSTGSVTPPAGQWAGQGPQSSPACSAVVSFSRVDQYWSFA